MEMKGNSPSGQSGRKCTQSFSLNGERNDSGIDIYELWAAQMSWLVDHGIGKSKTVRMDTKNFREVMWMDQ